VIDGFSGSSTSMISSSAWTTPATSIQQFSTSISAVAEIQGHFGREWNVTATALENFSQATLPTVQYSETRFFIPIEQLGFYLQDSYRITPRLTFNYGLR